MKILLISRCPPYPLHFGDRLIVYHLARSLQARGHHLDLLAFADRDEDWNEQDHYERFFGKVALFEEPRRTLLDYLRRQALPDKRFPRRAQDAWSGEMWQAIERQVRDEPYDVAHFFGGVQVYEYFHAVGSVPAVITPYESYSLYLRRQWQAGSKARPRSLLAYGLWQMARRFERWMFTPFARTVVLADRDRDELAAINAELALDVIPNGVDVESFRLEPTAREANRLLFTGNYEYAPNVDAALSLATDILPQVRARIPDATLWLVGNAPPRALQALASESVEVTGRVPEIKSYLARASVFVSPLQLGAGIKNKVLEALAMGCPVVATPLSVDGIAVRDGWDARIVDSARMAEAVTEVLRDDSLRERLSREGRALVERQYTWDRVAEQYEALYAQVIGASSSSAPPYAPVDQGVE